MINYDLSMEQQFHLRKLQDAADNLTADEARTVLKDYILLCMMKDCVIKSLIAELSQYTLGRNLF